MGVSSICWLSKGQSTNNLLQSFQPLVFLCFSLTLDLSGDLCRRFVSRRLQMCQSLHYVVGNPSTTLAHYRGHAWWVGVTRLQSLASGYHYYLESTLCFMDKWNPPCMSIGHTFVFRFMCICTYIHLWRTEKTHTACGICRYLHLQKTPYGSVCAGREKWLFNVIFFLKVEPSCDQTWWDSPVFFLQLSVVYHMFLVPKTLWLDLWGHLKVP